MKLSIAEIDKKILFIYITLSIFGVLMILDIVSVRHSYERFIRQLIWVGLTIPIFLIVYNIPLYIIRKLAFPLVMISIILLIGTLIPGIGVEVNGVMRRIQIGSFGFQPSILARLALIIYIAHILDKNQEFIEDAGIKNFLMNFRPLWTIPLIIFILIYFGRDFSTAAITFILVLTIFFLARIRLSIILSIILIALILVFVIIQMGPKYRKARIITYVNFILNKEIPKEKQEYIYQPKQSLIAISNGRILGVGSKRGRAKLFYLPFPETDYIFSVIVEEWGFIMSLLILSAYSYIFYRGMRIAVNTNSLFTSLLIAGCSLNIIINVIINVAVAIVLIPSTGVTLPFISYGGSSFMINSLCIAIILNANRSSISLNGKKWQRQRNKLYRELGTS
ncbi:MAG: hypothetical protein DRH57_05170 [Candidatus Cloacimonadota bacterium]|nr:MAG: hypothetical protein DRH57_05170 [Candidatus Cloacimonadota bacterium]